MAELAEDVIRYLISKEIATAIGVDAFIGYIMETDDIPAKCLAVFDTGGGQSELALSDVKRTLQIFVRDQDYDTGRKNAWLAYNALDKPKGRVLTMNGRKGLVRALQVPTAIKRDTKDRTTFVFNISVITTRD